MSLEKYKELTHRYQRFIYEGYQIEENENKFMLNFQYKFEGKGVQTLAFNHRISYQLKSPIGTKLKLDLIKELGTMIFSIGLVESINYYKMICPKIVHVTCGYLTEEQKKWWQKLFYHGLGELIYLNNLADEVTEASFVTFTSNNYLSGASERAQLSLSGNLIPVGGGKDSVVTLDLLKGQKANNLCFVLSPPEAAYDCIKVAGYEEYLLAKRYLDKQILTMNQAGYLNGHVPFSAILGFISVLGAALTGKKYIVLSNEGSANEATVKGESFNHQYSKSYEFETDFNRYVETYLSNELTYFSLLRSMYELEIAKRFSKLTHYHTVFRSCNRGKKENNWCGVCSKCLFVYIILGPFLSREALKQIFNKNLLEEKALKPIFRELIGLEDVKPFECVGTVEEVRFAMKEIVQAYKRDQVALPELAQFFVEAVNLETIHILEKDTFLTHIPESYKEILEEVK